MEKITVSTEELRVAHLPDPNQPVSVAPERPAIPIGLRIASAALVIALPLLCLLTVALRLSLRGKPTRLQLAWAQWLNSLLVASGLLTTLLFSMAYFVRPRPVANLSALPVLGYGGSYPVLPAATAWTAQQLAREMDSLVFVVNPELGVFQTPRSYQEAAAVGAGVLLQATKDGFLVATNRHVVDEHSWLRPRQTSDSVILFQKEGPGARGQVIARHTELDLALVWTARASGDATFVQPVAPFAEAETGQSVFVIGHPQRLFFSLSTGIVMRQHEENLLQISAPVSPGNSGGPVYDEFGRLLAVVSFKVDRRFNPNAENLNFAVRADALLAPGGWAFAQDGERILEQYREDYDEAQRSAVFGIPGGVPGGTAR